MYYSTCKNYILKRYKYFFGTFNSFIIFKKIIYKFLKYLSNQQIFLLISLLVSYLRLFLGVITTCSLFSSISV